MYYFIFFILVFVNVYVRSEYEKIELNISKFIIHGKENHDELLSNTKNVVSYERLLTFYPGLDNDIIYDPKTVVDEDGNSKYEEELDETKILWGNLLFGDDILTFEANSCGTNLSDNEFIIYLSERFYNKEYLVIIILIEFIYIYCSLKHINYLKKD